MDALRERALRVAAEALPRELERVSASDAADLLELCGAGSEERQHTTLAASLADSFIGCLLSPPGDATPKLTVDTPQAEAHALAEIYWRCLVAVALMPTPALESLARHHADLQAGYLAPLLNSVASNNDSGSTASTVSRRRLLVEAVLPRFSMTCTTQEEAEAAERRRNEIEAMKKQAAAEDTAEAQQRAAAPAAGATPLTAAMTRDGAPLGESESGVLL